MSDNNTSVSFGCLSLIVLIVVLWACCFGITYHGHHYEMRCNGRDGVNIQ